MVYFPNESDRREFGYFFADGPTFLLVEATQALLHRLGAWPNVQGVLGDVSQKAWHV